MLLDLQSLAELLRVNPSWVQSRLATSHADRIPHIRLGRYPRFDPDSEEFKTWLARHRVESYDGAHSEVEVTKRTYQRGRVEKRKRVTRTYYVLRYRLRDGARWIEKTEELDASTPRDASTEADTRMLEINQINNVRATSAPRLLPFNLFIKTFWNQYTARLKPSTRYSYESILDTWIIPAFGDLHIQNITPAAITELLNTLAGKSLSTKYLINVYALLRVMFEVAVEYSLIESSPVRRKLHRPQLQDKREKPALSAEQVSAVLANVPADHRALFVLLSITILRIGELLALRWFNLDFPSRSLSITHNLWRGQLVTPKTRASEKTFRLPRPVLAVLETHRAVCSRTAPEDFIFSRLDGRPLDQDLLREQIYYPALKAAGIQPEPRTHGFHLLRHSGASILYQLTHDLKLVQSHARHAQVSTTGDIYVHLGDEVSDEAGEILADAILPKMRLVKQK